jgi:hypothetical protein
LKVSSAPWPLSVTGVVASVEFTLNTFWPGPALIWRPSSVP